ncbi:hypothetical protein [Bradyrhizobium sp. ORS 375]|uniref:hypothetical protein n=1 Tax=Bradyrhizobium sp. (strain ORS 375) TaxID=566679 RepID=UPI001111DC45|nr:hypothetical protein [Bradyrhizobium sp. ORS 375]
MAMLPEETHTKPCIAVGPSLRDFDAAPPDPPITLPYFVYRQLCSEQNFFPSKLGPTMRFSFLVTSIIVLLCTANSVSAQTQETTLPAPGTISVDVRPPQKPSAEQITRYKEKARLLEEHDVPVQTLAAAIPFSSRLSNNRVATIKPRPQSLFSDGINVKDQIDTTKLAGMDYHYVSTVAEPSAAVAGDKILIAFNWGAVWSTDRGKSFQQLDPFSLFDQPHAVVGRGFCCDQLVFYDKPRDLLIWLLQGSDGGDGNTVRLLFAKSTDLTPGKQLQWHVYDLSPATIGGWTGEWFDFPDMTTTNQNLIISFNLFSSADDPPEFRRSAILRLSLDELANYGPTRLTFQQDECKCAFSPRLTQGNASTVYWATHEDTATLLVRSWSDGETSAKARQRVKIEPYQYPSGGAEGPNGKPWLARLDDRITAGWIADGHIGFAWNSGPIGDGSGVARYPLPHIRVAIIDASNLTSGSPMIHLSESSQPHIWSSAYAFAYATAAPSQSGDIGVGLYFGGRTKYPSAAVGFLRSVAGEWKVTLTVAVEGQNTPRCPDSSGIDNRCGKWGDYLAIKSDPSTSNGWYLAVATERDTDPNQQPQIAVSFIPFRSTPQSAIASPQGR